MLQPELLDGLGQGRGRALAILVESGHDRGHEVFEVGRAPEKRVRAHAPSQAAVISARTEKSVLAPRVRPRQSTPAPRSRMASAETAVATARALAV